MTIFAIDPSLTSTGLAIVGDEDIRVCTIASSGRRNDTITQRAQRIQDIADEAIRWAYPILTTADHCDPDLIVIEGPTPGTRGGSVWDRAGLWWRIVSQLPVERVAVVSPPSRAKWATGNGRADKAAVASVIARLCPDVELRNSDEADALCLALMGMHALEGHGGNATKYRYEALLKCQWPESIAKRLLGPYEIYDREVVA